MSIEEKFGKNRSKFRKVYSYGMTFAPDIKIFIDSVTETTQSINFQKIIRDRSYFLIDKVGQELALPGPPPIFYEYLEDTVEFTSMESVSISFPTAFSSIPYLAFQPSQSFFTHTDGEETPSIGWWATNLDANGFTANFTAPFTGKITYRGIYTTEPFPIYVNRGPDLSGSYGWVSAGTQIVTDQSFVSMSYSSLPSLPEFFNYNFVGADGQELSVGQAIRTIGINSAVNELSDPTTGVMHFVALDIDALDSSPVLPDPDVGIPGV